MELAAKYGPEPVIIILLNGTEHLENDTMSPQTVYYETELAEIDAR